MNTTTDLPKIVSSKMRVRFQDCDPFNHLNNAEYINYMINAREDQLLKNYDFDIYGIAIQSGITWVVATNQIAYLKPALLMEELIIESQLISYNDKSLQVEIRMFDSNRELMKSFMWVTFAHFNIKTQRSQTHSEDYMGLFEQLHLPLDQQTFQERFSYLSATKQVKK